jgi:hypothetical protein
VDFHGFLSFVCYIHSELSGGLGGTPGRRLLYVFIDRFFATETIGQKMPVVYLCRWQREAFRREAN